MHLHFSTNPQSSLNTKRAECLLYQSSELIRNFTGVRHKTSISIIHTGMGVGRVESSQTNRPEEDSCREEPSFTQVMDRDVSDRRNSTPTSAKSDIQTSIKMSQQLHVCQVSPKVIKNMEQRERRSERRMQLKERTKIAKISINVQVCSECLRQQICL